MRSFVPVAAAAIPAVFAYNGPQGMGGGPGGFRRPVTTFATSVRNCSPGFPSSSSQYSYAAPSSSQVNSYPTPALSQYWSAPAYSYSSRQYSESQYSYSSTQDSEPQSSSFQYSSPAEGETTSAIVESTSAAAVVASSTAAAAAGSSGTGASIISTLAGGSGVGGTTCTVTAAADATASASACSNILLSGVTVPASEGLTVTVPSGGALLFAGTMTVEYTPDTDYTPIVIKGSNAKVAGLAGAVIDGQGSDYWDGEGSNGGTDKPDHFIKIDDMESSSFSELTIQNWPTHLFEITGCSDLTMQNLILNNKAGDEEDSDGDTLGHNTDAFDVSSTDGLYVSGATVYNQDDCVAVNSGSNMVFENLYCSGGHGLSIGSIESGVTVSNITFQDCSVVESENGCRIKTDAGDDDSTVSDITYSNIYLSGITDYAIDVQQDYENGDPTGDPTSGITVEGVTFEYITGTVSGDDAYEYYILCGDGSCSDFTWTDVEVTGGKTSCSPSGSICPSS